MSDAFANQIQELLSKYANTPLVERWKDATSFGAGEHADAYFIRDAPDSVNVIWLNTDGIRDITWFPEEGTETVELPESMFNFIPLSNVVSFEVHEAQNAARTMGVSVAGDFLVQVFLASSPRGQLYWIAHTPEEVFSLRSFLSTVLTAYIAASH